MLNRNAAYHLLLVASILLCAFIYAGYSLATRGDAEPAEDAAATAENAASGLRPAGSGGDAAALPIPPANGEELSLTPPAAQSMRPPPVAALSPDSEAISGLVPGDAGATEDAAVADAGGLMPGTVLPLPGFSSAPVETAAAESASPPVLTLPGMGGTGEMAATADEDFGDEDFGDFAALPGFDEPAAETAAAPVLTPPPGAATPAPPPAATTPAVETSAVLRPPPPGIPPARNAPAAAPAPAVPPPPAATARPVVSTPPPPARATPPDGLAEEEEDVPGPRSDSLRIYVVMPGDTLSSIAMRELGSGFLADNIFLLNRDVIVDPNQLIVGAKIRLPYANSPADGGGDAPAAPGVPPGRRPTQGLGGTHRVVRGDTLSSIAQQYYGQSAAWSFLHEANKAIIPNPNQLSVGMELSIPPYGE